VRWDTSNCKAYHSAVDFATELGCDVSAGKENARRAVCHLRGVASSR
jgi:hypothetical protein